MSQPEEPELLYGHNGSYRVDRDAGLVRVGPRELLPAHFWATIDAVGALPAVTLEIEVDVGGPPRCRSLTVTAPDGTEVTSEMVRSVPVRRLVRDAAAGALEKFELNPDGTPRPAPMTGDDVFAFRTRLDGRREPGQVATRSDDELLTRVATIYRDAPRAPTQAVASALQYSRAHAGRLVMQARDRGFLGPARRGVAGEVTTDQGEN
jgi:hypothetical protein